MNPLAQYLSSEKVTQASLAESLGWRQSIVSRIARGEVKITLERAQALEAATQGRVRILDWPHFANVIRAASHGVSSATQAEGRG